MDKILKDKKIQIIKIKSFLEKYAKLSEENYDITKIPFFSKSNNSKDFYIDYKTIKEKIPKGLNRNIKLLYNIVGHPNKEIYIGEWTILSLKKCMENYIQCQKHLLHNEQGHLRNVDEILNYLCLFLILQNKS